MSLNKVNYVHGQTIISAQNMNDIQDEIIRLGEKAAIQSDWSQNDETALDFIKNRTHWSNHQEGEFFNGLFENNDGIWGFISENTTLPRLDSNEKYQVIIENEVFESNLRLATGEEMDLEGANVVYIFGNHSLVFPDTDNTGEPFTLALIEAVDGNVSVVVGMLTLLDDIPRQNEGYSIKISGKVINSIKKLDEIYMPESYDAAKTVLSNLMDQMSEVETEISDHAIDIGHLQLDVLNVLKSTTQTLTEAQKARARKNIGAISVNEVPIQPLPSHLPEAAVVEASEFSPRLEFEIPDKDWGSGWPSGYIAAIQDEELYDMLMTDKTLFYSFDNTTYNKLYPFNWEGAYALAPNPTNFYESFYIAPIQSNNGKMVLIRAKENKFNKIFLNIAHYRMDYYSRLMSADTIPPTIARLTDITNALENLITLEDIDFICAKIVKVTFPNHGLSVKISYTDSKGVYHANEDLPGVPTTYVVLKDTPIILNGNFFNETSFVLPEDSKYYTKVSDSEIIPHMDFEIKYADGAPA